MFIALSINSEGGGARYWVSNQLPFLTIEPWGERRFTEPSPDIISGTLASWVCPPAFIFSATKAGPLTCPCGVRWTIVLMTLSKVTIGSRSWRSEAGLLWSALGESSPPKQLSVANVG
jgi:hypothetical protein